MTPTVSSKITPMKAMELLRMSLDDVIDVTGLGRAAAHRAVYGSSHSINRRTATLIAEAFGVSVLDIDWPSDLTKTGRPPLTGGSYTVGVGSAKQKTPGGLGQPIADGEMAIGIKKRLLPEVFCTNPEHNLLLAVSGVCDLCVA